MPPLPDEPADLLPDVRLAVVDVLVDPLGVVGLEVTVLLDEDSVGSTDVVAAVLVEGVAAVVDGLAGPAGLPGVDGEHQDVVAGSPGTVEEREGDLVVVAHVELEEARSLGVAVGAGGAAPDRVGLVLDGSTEVVGSGNTLDGAAGSGGKDVRKSEFTSDPVEEKKRGLRSAIPDHMTDEITDANTYLAGMVSPPQHW